MLRAFSVAALAAMATCAFGCSGEDELVVPTRYEFRDASGVDTVDYAGQTMRHVLILDLTSAIAGLTEAIDAGRMQPAEGKMVEALDYYLRFDSDRSGDDPIAMRTTPSSLQERYRDIAVDKNLIDKLAGNDSATDHEDWHVAFRGWDDASMMQHGGSLDSPEGFVSALFETIEANAMAHASGATRTAPGSSEPLPVHVTASGIDLAQLTQKFLLGAVAMSQGLDDYLDDDVAGKGLLSSNELEADAAHSELAHAWDEAFGYFGAARDYGDYSDDEIAGAGGREDWRGSHDTNGDGRIDLRSETSFGASTNAGKRDRGAVVATDFSGEAWTAFLTGRAIIARTEGPLSADDLAELRVHRDAIALAWEGAYAATMVHYINEVLVDMTHFGTGEYSFVDHAKHFSELKGFALGLQFNPRSPLGAADFVRLHELLGDSPMLSDASELDRAGYRDRLIEARTLIGATYGFDPANLGDQHGAHGW